MANEPQSCNCAFCLKLYLFDVNIDNLYDLKENSINSNIYKTSKKKSVYTCNPKDKSVVSKHAVRTSVSQEKFKNSL